MRQPKGIDRTIALGMLGAGALVGVAAAAPAASAATVGPATPRTAAQTYQMEWTHLGQIKLYPLAGTAVDPLSNSLGTNLAGLPVNTAPVTAAFADGLPLRDLPLVGGVLPPPASPSTATSADDEEEAQPAQNAAAGPVGLSAPAGPVLGLVPAAAQPPLFGPLQ